MSSFIINPYNVVPAGTWTETFSQALDLDSGGWSLSNGRMIIPASLLSTSGTKFRLTMEAASAEDMKISNAYFGHSSGVGYDFTGNQVRVTVASSGTFTVPAGTSVVSDEISYAVNEATAVVLSWISDDGTKDGMRGKNGIVGTITGFKALGVDEASDTSVSGYTDVSERVSFINRIEVFA